MNSKKCVFCKSVHVKKEGFQKGIQKWKCKDCLHYFQANRKALPEKEELFLSFVFHKQTLHELSLTHHLRTTAIQKYFDEYSLAEKTHTPRKVFLVVDGTYFGEREGENTFCLVVFRDPVAKEDLWWKFYEVETYDVYKEGRAYLESLEYIIEGVIADGLPLIRNSFRGTPFQMCLVHMERIIIRGTTKYPLLEAGKVLLALSSTLYTTDEVTLRRRVIDYKNMYTSFLNQRAVNPLTGESWFMHRELRKAFISLCNLLPFLFTYTNHKGMSATSNSLEGHFSHIKRYTAVHNGLSLQRKQKLITAILLNSSVTLDEEKEGSS